MFGRKSIYIDCGGHVGQTIQRFKSMTQGISGTEIHSFEPHPRLYPIIKEYEGKNIFVYDKAVWNKDGYVDFYLDVLDEVDGSGWDHPGQGSTTSKGKTTGTLDKEHPYRAETIDLNRWIIENFSKDDYIYIKMDIEGGEYDVLPNMIEGGSIEYINEFDIEFHSHKIGLDEQVHKDLLDSLFEATKGIDINIRTH
jgi:FkbM family methyltransferase